MQVGVHAHGLISDSELMADEYYPRYAGQMDRIGKSRGWSPYTRQQFAGGISPDGALFIGDPNPVIEKILFLQETFGLTRFMMHTDIGAPSHMSIMRSIELLGREVVPAVKKAVAAKK